jgi:lipopolysaccharide/colanic/teichoic acid biosynthesis glycosyltransferase
MEYALIKRIIDFWVALIALLVLSPILLIVMVLLAWKQRGKVFFTQERPGYKGRIFKVIKFKTMRDDRDAKGKLLPDSQRLTGIGKWVRSSSLDELPQLLNVIKGDMSFVGPRPLLVEYLNKYTPHQMRRHEVTPGITGWAQVNGRNQITWEQKFDYDVYYVDHQGFALDIKILWLSVWKVLKRDGISAEGAATMHKFTGSNEKSN